MDIISAQYRQVSLRQLQTEEKILICSLSLCVFLWRRSVTSSSPLTSFLYSAGLFEHPSGLSDQSHNSSVRTRGQAEQYICAEKIRRSSLSHSQQPHRKCVDQRHSHLITPARSDGYTLLIHSLQFSESNYKPDCIYYYILNSRHNFYSNFPV